MGYFVPLPGVQTLPDMLVYHAERSADKIALTFDENPRTFGSIRQGMDRFAGWLVEHDIAPGDRVVLVLPNSHEFFDAFYGVQRAGAIAVPVFSGSGPTRILEMAERCRARAIVISSMTPADQQRALRQQAAERDLWLTTVSDTSNTSRLRSFPQVNPGDVAMIQYTSGSTGQPKGVMLTHHNLMTNVGQLIDGMHITTDDIFVSWLPVYHDMGLILKTLVPFYLAAVLHLLPTSLTNASRWLDAIQRHKATFTAAPDFAYRLALRAIKDPARYDLSSLRVALNAAEIVRPTTILSFEDAFGIHQVMTAGYGLAEATVGVSMSPPRVSLRVDESGFVSVGFPFRGVEVRIVEGDTTLPSYTTGDIVVRSEANSAGYFRDEAATARLNWGEGFYRTGDIGYLDGDGWLTIVGRRKNVIKRAGQTIAPYEIEQIVELHQAVRSAAAVGIDRGGTEGEQIIVFVEVRRPGSLTAVACEDLVIELVDRIFAHMGFRPARLILVRPRTIPITHNGKLQHGLLKERYLMGELDRADQIIFPGY